VQNDVTSMNTAKAHKLDPPTGNNAPPDTEDVIDTSRILGIPVVNPGSFVVNPGSFSECHLQSPLLNMIYRISDKVSYQCQNVQQQLLYNIKTWRNSH